MTTFLAKRLIRAQPVVLSDLPPESWPDFCFPSVPWMPSSDSQAAKCEQLVTVSNSIAIAEDKSHVTLELIYNYCSK